MDNWDYEPDFPWVVVAIAVIVVLVVLSYIF